MNRLFWYICGYWRVKISGAAPEWVLNRLTASRIPFWDLHWLDAFTLEISIFRQDLRLTEQTSVLSQCEVQQIEEIGAANQFKSFLHRPVFLTGVLITMVFLIVLPNFLLFYHVAGNEMVPDAQILRALEDLDIGVGFYGPNIKPKWIKDHILQVLPELQWITVTQNGCMAQVVVRERPEIPETLERRGYAHVIATQSGMITKQSVYAGKAVHEPGDFVLAGEMLVCGLVDLERTYTLEYAQAEIYARTWRKKTVVMPENSLEKGELLGTTHSVWIEFGKKRIKIFGNSGISTAGCDKMIFRKILTLPYDLKLPVSLLVETNCFYSMEEELVSQECALEILADYAERSAVSQMCAGEILHHSTAMEQDNGCHVLTSVLECHEMIAQTVESKWNEEDFIYD